MTVRKRTTKKTGNGSRRTTTISTTRGLTQSYSNKPTKQSPRRTVSFNHKTGKTRTNYSQKLGGGYTKIMSKTTGGSKTKTSKYRTSKTSKTSTRSSFSGTDSSPFIFLFLLSIPLLGIMYLWPVTMPYIAGLIGGIVLLLVVVNLIIAALPYVIFGALLYVTYSVVKVLI